MGVRLGMLVVETIAKIRRAYFAQKKPIKAICREFRVSRKVVRKVIRSEATEFRYERSRQPLPKIGPWRAENRRAVAGEREQACTRAADADPYIRGAARPRLWRQLRRGSSLRQGMACRARGGDGGSLRTAELCTGRGLPVRLVARGRADQRHDGHRQGGARPAVS